MRARVVLAAAGAVAMVAALGACSKNTGSDTNSNDTSNTQSGSISNNPKDSTGPAPAVAGAKRGGTVYQYLEADYDHLDPTRAYVNNATAVDNLLTRTLTMFKEGSGGKLLLVGDLATNAGKDTSGGKCTQWSYTLKSGLKYEDGTAITAADVAYGVARSFSPKLADGPHYIQQWLADSINYNKTYKGPYDGGKKVPPGVTVSGQKITFNFKQPHCDLPFAASWGTTAPLPASRDTKPQGIDQRPFSSGPYKVKQYIRDTKLVLERNKYWDPKSDAIRHNYFDTFQAVFGASADSQANAIKSSQGRDANAIMGANVPPAQLPNVQRDASAKKRVAAGFTQFVWYMAINNQRITGLKERQALNYGFDKRQFIQALGGSTAGEKASTLLSPTTIGYEKYDAYPYDLAKAKKLLGGKHPTLVFAFANTARWQKLAVSVQSILQKVGFKITLKPIDSASYYTQIGTDHNAYDLYFAGWGSDWPSGSTIIPPVMDGRTIAPQGNTTYPYFSNAAVNKQIDALSRKSANAAAKGWAALDKQIMTKYAPVVPVYYDKAYQLYGTKLANVKIAQSTGWPVYYNIYVKS